jgi:hypothetical protein
MTKLFGYDTMIVQFQSYLSRREKTIQMNE